ncbi:hypothetical protein ARMGADRAFT_567191 [Armillaria gallica]|uniref:Uncharacterized protein n=1 Tax=Armillaria gallica TaxID=47427 RepID=A0A2H3E2Z8_ARMGA|nr:hypothetical protein ARMGADRAFT_567191 [Armillaria gallica]
MDDIFESLMYTDSTEYRIVAISGEKAHHSFSVITSLSLTKNQPFVLCTQSTPTLSEVWIRKAKHRDSVERTRCKIGLPQSRAPIIHHHLHQRSTTLRAPCWNSRKYITLIIAVRGLWNANMNQSRRLRGSCGSSLVSEDEEAEFNDAFALSDIHYLPLFKRLKCYFVVLK